MQAPRRLALTSRALRSLRVVLPAMLVACGESTTGSKTSLEDPLSSGERGGLRSGTNRPKGRTRDQLYAEAQHKNVKGRSQMNNLR